MMHIQTSFKIRDKPFKKYKIPTLNVDKHVYKTARYNVQNLISRKKIGFFENKLTERVGKPKDLWREPKSLDVPYKSGGCIVRALVEKQLHVVFFIRKIFISRSASKTPKSLRKC